MIQHNWVENQNFWQYHSMSSTQQFCAKYLLEWDFLCLKAVYCTAHNILWWFSLFLIVDYYNTVFMLKRCFSKKRKNTGKSHRIATFQFCSSTWSDFTFASIFVKHKQGNRLAHIYELCFDIFSGGSKLRRMASANLQIRKEKGQKSSSRHRLQKNSSRSLCTKQLYHGPWWRSLSRWEQNASSKCSTRGMWFATRRNLSYGGCFGAQVIIPLIY